MEVVSPGGLFGYEDLAHGYLGLAAAGRKGTLLRVLEDSA